MAAQSPSAALKAAVQEDTGKKALTQLRSDVIEFIQTLSGQELAEAVLERLQRYAAKTVAARRADADQLSALKKLIRDELSTYLSHFITDAHREFIVRCHARGLSTSAAVWELMREDLTMNRLGQEDAMGVKRLKEILILRLAYLKPGTARWPEKKYGGVWHDAREGHIQEKRNIPLTSRAEQIALLARHAERIERELASKTHNVKDFQSLTKSLTQTLESLRKLSAMEEALPESVSGLQVVEVLERLKLPSKAPEERTDNNGLNALPAPSDSDEDDTEENN